MDGWLSKQAENQAAVNTLKAQRQKQVEEEASGRICQVLAAMTGTGYDSLYSFMDEFFKSSSYFFEFFDLLVDRRRWIDGVIVC